MTENRPRLRDREATTAALRQAAMRIFAARGYDAATTREVAQSAGVSEQLIQRYFGGKAGLLLAIMKLYAERDREAAFGIPPAGATVEEEIANFLRFHIERERQAADFARVGRDDRAAGGRGGGTAVGTDRAVGRCGTGVRASGMTPVGENVVAELMWIQPPDEGFRAPLEVPGRHTLRLAPDHANDHMR